MSLDGTYTFRDSRLDHTANVVVLLTRVARLISRVLLLAIAVLGSQPLLARSAYGHLWEFHSTAAIPDFSMKHIVLDDSDPGALPSLIVSADRLRGANLGRGLVLRLPLFPEPNRRARVIAGRDPTRWFWAEKPAAYDAVGRVDVRPNGDIVFVARSDQRCSLLLLEKKTGQLHTVLDSQVPVMGEDGAQYLSPRAAFVASSGDLVVAAYSSRGRPERMGDPLNWYQLIQTAAGWRIHSSERGDAPLASSVKSDPSARLRALEYRFGRGSVTGLTLDPDGGLFIVVNNNRIMYADRDEQIGNILMRAARAELEGRSDEARVRVALLRERASLQVHGVKDFTEACLLSVSGPQANASQLAYPIRPTIQDPSPVMVRSQDPSTWFSRLPAELRKELEGFVRYNGQHAVFLRFRATLALQAITHKQEYAPLRQYLDPRL